jgi:hypothetical protein
MLVLRSKCVLEPPLLAFFSGSDSISWWLDTRRRN